MPERFGFLDSSGPIAFAHRGASPDGRENTLAAVERVVRLGFTYLETDVRVSRDGVPLLMHDSTLDRTTDKTGAVADLPWSQIARARVAGTEPVPRLDELFAGFPELKVNLHVKTAAAVGPLAEVVRRANALDRVCVAAFQDRFPAAARVALGPGLCTGLGTRGVLALKLASLRGGTVRPIGACAQVPPVLGPVRVIDRQFVEAAHRSGLAVHAWTINDAVEMRRLLDLGVDGIMSDRAETLLGVLRERDAA
ncbi:MAG TPA: glycerophosphodiester phosphodiesterase family protein [Mycobacteriales bacterium]|nr:glycerophosphodiester phosphodiesterase family protein [Mycobacteriales bacterium]